MPLAAVKCITLQLFEVFNFPTNKKKFLSLQILGTKKIKYLLFLSCDITIHNLGGNRESSTTHLKKYISCSVV